MGKCKKHYDLKGKRFGYLIPLRRVSKENEITVWKCRCEFCGNTTNVRYTNLISGNTKRCQRCKGRKFDIIQSKKILKEKESGMTLAVLAEKYNVSRYAISNAIKFAKKEQDA